MSEQLIALNRFGLGARADSGVLRDPKRSLLQQLERFDARPPALRSLPDTSAMVTYLADAQREGRRLRQMRRMNQGNNDPATRRRSGLIPEIRSRMRDAAATRLQLAIDTATPFPERLVHFWSNHFAVSVDKPTIVGLAGPFEVDAIRPHVLGNFADMLKASVVHPAMLLYLDQAQSLGPGSPIGQRMRQRARRQRGLNENLAREILELHTLGVDGGYTQDDVLELAKALTGWTVAGLNRRNQDGEPVVRFARRMHEPGRRRILGKNYPEGGANQADAILSDLAQHPSTARHVATKLARHFAGDDPPSTLIDGLASRYLETGGDLPALYHVLVQRPEAWSASPKFRSPWDWLVASGRAIDLELPNPRLGYRLAQELGQPTWRPGSPAGFADVSASWAGSDALMRRVEVADRLARMARGIDPRDLAGRIFPDSLSENSMQTIRRAESEQQGIALLLASPEMMRR